MFILRDIIIPLQQEFTDTKLGQKRARWFTFTLLAVILPFTSSITSNLLRSLQALFGLEIKFKQYYSFMGSPRLHWDRLWKVMWNQIPNPAILGRVIVALDDSISPKSGHKIFGCSNFHNHATKANESSYPWSQCIVAIGLLKQVKGRWACIPLDFRFYFMIKDILGKSVTAMRRGRVLPFESKLWQAAVMIQKVNKHFNLPVLIVADSWFGNDGLWSRLSRGSGGKYHLLSRLRSNLTLFSPPIEQIKKSQDKKGKRGRNLKYGDRLGNVDQYTTDIREMARSCKVFLYGKKREISLYSEIVMLKTLKCPVRVVWVFRNSRYVALFTTDLTLSVEQIVEYYGARWKIESGFKEIKQELGSSKAQVRNSEAVINHFNFCMMAATLTWIYADKLQTAPDRKHKIKGRASFAFSDIRKMIAEAALNPDFHAVCPLSGKTPQNSFVGTLLRIVA